MCKLIVDNKNDNYKNKSFAYTLAEILTVMVIFSVAMGILVRTIVRVDPDKNKLLFVKAYQATEEVFAQSLNDGLLYDQNIYTRTELENWTDDRHFNLADTPLFEAKITFIDDSKQKTACPSSSSGENACDVALTKNNAPCLYIARYLNTLGPVSCSGESSEELNLRTSTGICYYNWSASSLSDTQKSFDAVIDPNCSRTATNKAGYAIRVYASGAMEVPEKSDMTNDDNQKRALQWLKSPTTVD